MMELKRTETARLVEQVRLDGLKSGAERNEWGQFATPPELAEEILRYAATLTDKVRFVDPAVGTGSFYSALLRVFGAKRVEGAAGIELDHGFAEAARRLWGDRGLEVMEADFTTLTPQPRFNLLISNPPYVRHHHLEAGEKIRLGRRVFLEQGIQLSGLAGLYCYFLLLSDGWVEPGGLSIWLIPSEFMDVNYGSGVKRYLTERVQLLQIHRFSPADVQFADALVSSAIVVFRKSAPADGQAVKMTYGGSLLEPDQTSLLALDTLRRARKWTGVASGSVERAEAGHRVTLGDLFTIKRGLATGANSFFILPEEQAAREGIPARFRKPILPNPRQVSSDIIDADERGYPVNVTRLALIDCDLPEEEVRARFPHFWEYLRRGKAEHVHATYLASRRHPWYSQERREAAPFLFTYMGRSTQGRKPFRVIWNKSAATAHNVYLLLYPKPALQRALNRQPRLFEVVFEYLRSIDAGSLVGEGRVYGGGLHKLEPRELARVGAEDLWRALGAGHAAGVRKAEQIALAL